MRQGDPMAAEYLLDVLGDKPVLALPTHRRDPATHHSPHSLVFSRSYISGSQRGMSG